EYVLIEKHHPFVQRPPVISATDRDFAQDFTNAMSIEELLCVADVCISDYSSLVFEYSLFEKPLIFFSYDLSEYFDWRGFYYDYYELAPGPIFTTNREMIDYIRHIDERFDKQRVIDFRNKFMSACDGHATERIMDIVFGQEQLSKYRKEYPVVDQYSMIPSAFELFSEKEQRIENLKWWKTKGNELYLDAAKKPVQKGFVAIFMHEENKDVIERLIGKLQSEDVLTPIVVDEHMDKKSLILLITTCEFILLTQASDVINALQIRPETSVVLAWDEILPIEKSGYSSKEFRGGLCKDYTDIAPLHYAYDLIPMAGERVEDIYKEVFGVEKEGVCQPLGSITTDILFDKEFRKRSKERLYEIFPAAKDKKVIFYLPQYRIEVKRPSGEVFLDYGFMNEYLKDEYAIVYISPKSNHSQKNGLFPYYSHFICDMTEKMSVYECMVCADMMIGDYLPAVYTFAVLDRPILLYAPDYQWYLFDRDTYFSYEESAPGPVLGTMEEVVDMLMDMTKYDESKQRKFKEAYLTNCDGHAIDRLIQEMK
ncbi:MAG: CDP-glycerol glycerophosphotransferase family protein, partial [bacterium]|nr:CDP-glycerol glycerophosphotransferase family protein [bacterium]